MIKTKEFIDKKIKKKIRKIFKNSDFRFIKDSKNELIIEAENFKILFSWDILSKNKKLGEIIKDLKKEINKNHVNVGIIILPPGTRFKKFDVFKNKKIKVWEITNIDYFNTVSNSIGGWAKYEILARLGYTKKFDRAKKIPSISIKQPGGNLYVFSIDPETLLKMAYVFRRPVSPKAYQRMLSPERIKKTIPSFLDKEEAILPTNITCVLPPQTTFKKNRLVIPSKFSSIWIVDGQHRLYSFANIKNLENLKKFKLICVGLKNTDFPPKKQGKIFIDINYYAKKVSTDLLLDLYEILNIKDRRVEIVKSLNSKGVFKNKIKSPSNPKGIIALPTFSLTPAMDSLVRNGGYLNTYYKGKFQENKFQDFCIRNINLFFSIISRKLKSMWEDPKKYIICTNRGIRAFLRLFPFVLNYSNGIKEKNFEKPIICLKDFEFLNSELRRKYLGEGGADEFAKNLVEHIQRKIPDFPSYKIQEVIRTLTIVPGEKKKANDFIKKWLGKLEGKVEGELSYIDPSTLEYLEFLSTDCKKIELLVSVIDNESDCFKKAESFIKHTKKELTIKKITLIEPESKKPFEHERWLANKEYEIDFGTDLKNSAIGNKKHTIVIKNKPFLSKRLEIFKNIFLGLESIGKKRVEVEEFFPKK